MSAPVLTPLAPPRRFLASDVMFLVEHGLIDPNAKFELMNGAIIPMAAKGRFHEVLREEIEDWLSLPWASKFRVLREHTLVLDEETIVEPDFILYDRTRSIADAPLTGADIRLVIEVADSSWTYDIHEKAAKYAAFGATEYWALHAVNRTARIHNAAEGGAWKQVREFARGAVLAPLCAPEAPLTI